MRIRLSYNGRREKSCLTKSLKPDNIIDQEGKKHWWYLSWARLLGAAGVLGRKAVTGCWVGGGAVAGSTSPAALPWVSVPTSAPRTSPGMACWIKQNEEECRCVFPNTITRSSLSTISTRVRMQLLLECSFL